MKRISALLTVLAACDAVEAGAPAPEEGTTEARVAASPLVLDVGTAVLGGKMTVRVSGARANEAIKVAVSTNGKGDGPCPRFLGSQCLGLASPVGLLTTIRTDGAGRGTAIVPVPDAPALDGVEVCFQAAAVRGKKGRKSVLSNVDCSEAGYDGDGDGVLDAYDLCPGHDDALDADGDGVPDGCEPPPLTEYATPTYSLPLERYTFEGRDVAQIIPRRPVGLVFAFHGSGGGANFVEQPEVTILLQEFVDRGYGFVAVRSEEIGGGFDTRSAPAKNPDWRRVNDLRDHLVRIGSIAETTPLFAVGFSNGGGFTSWLGNTAPAWGWPLKAIALHNAKGWTAYYRELPDLPIAFLPSENDDVVPMSGVVDWYENHVASGHPGVLLPKYEEPLEPLRFARSPHIGRARSLALFDLLVTEGWFDADGHRRFRGDVLSAIEAMGNHPDFRPPKPAKGVLKVVLATHAFSSEHAEAEVDFFDAHR